MVTNTYKIFENYAGTKAEEIILQRDEEILKLEVAASAGLSLDVYASFDINPHAFVKLGAIDSMLNVIETVAISGMYSYDVLGATTIKFDLKANSGVVNITGRAMY